MTVANHIRCPSDARPRRLARPDVEANGTRIGASLRHLQSHKPLFFHQ
jgi:hypothetical protein